MVLLLLLYGRNSASQVSLMPVLAMPKPDTVETKKSAVVETVVSLTKYRATGNPMANGEMPYVGACAVSDYRIPFGSKVKIGKQIYIVCDRTDPVMQKKYGLTVDLFTTKSQEQCLEFGRRDTAVVIEIMRD